MFYNINELQLALRGVTNFISKLLIIIPIARKIEFVLCRK